MNREPIVTFARYSSVEEKQLGLMASNLQKIQFTLCLTPNDYEDPIHMITKSARPP